MDELEISGKRYISTRRAAREHGYHSDYMGQLIRGKKVAGQKVGRSWYIEEDSLNVYLGKPVAPAPAPVAAVEPEPAPAPERLIIEEPQPAPVPEPQPAAEIVAQPVVHVAQEIQQHEQPAVHVAPQYVAAPVAQPAEPPVQHVAYVEEETRIPIHIPASAIQEIGGLRYAADDAPIPVAMRMPQTYAQAYAPQAVHAPHATGKFPYISLSVVGVVAILAAAFASNFVSATIVSEQGKAATVQYAIHW